MKRLRLMFAAVLLALLAGAPACRAAELSWLRAQGTQIVDAGGKPVLLRGVNLGGWLLEEMWMSPFVTRPPEGSAFGPIKDHVTLWNVVRRRFGAADTYELQAAFRDAWINEDDFKRLRAAGFNSVRLPFIHDLEAEPRGLFFWLDRALDWGKKHGLYVILDMHGAPGRQSDSMITGEEGVNKLFSDPAMVERTARLWQRIARRYRDRPEVAGYNLLNEPMGAPNNSTLYLVQDRLYRAIREVDARHLIVIEDGYKGFDQMPHPAVGGWRNVVLSIHSYHFNARRPEDHLDPQLNGLVAGVRDGQRARGVPFYLGEFNVEPNATPEITATFVQTVQRQGWSWSLWTYKVAGPPGGRSLWGLYYANRPLDAINPFTDSKADMLRKMQPFRTENMRLYTEMQRALTAPPSPEVALTRWRWKADDRGEAAAAEMAAAPTVGADWRDAAVGQDVFAGRKGFAWFRATLPAISGARRNLRFDGVDDNATVYLNGQRLFRHEGWYGSFDVPLDGAWRAGGPNELAVLVENTNAGGGLTGPVTLQYADVAYLTPLPPSLLRSLSLTGKGELIALRSRAGWKASPRERTQRRVRSIASAALLAPPSL